MTEMTPVERSVLDGARTHPDVDGFEVANDEDVAPHCNDRRRAPLLLDGPPGPMRVWLRVLGLDLFDLSVSTDDVAEESTSTEEVSDPGSTTTYPVGYAVAEPPPLEATMPEWR